MSEARLRPSDREELVARRDESARRIETLQTEWDRNRLRLDEVAEELQQAERDLAAAEAVAEQGRDKVKRLKLNAEVLTEQQEKVDRRQQEAKAELAEVEASIGKAREVSHGATAITGHSDADALAVATRFGTFGERDMAAALRTDAKAAKKLIAKLVEAGQLKDTGVKMLGQRMYEYIATDAERDEATKEAKQLIRDWIVAQKAAFTRIQIKQATDTTDDEVDEVLQWMFEREIVVNIGVAGAEILQYSPPRGPGKAAEQQQKLRRAGHDPGVGGGSFSRGTVEGTGQKMKVTDPDVRALVAACERLGATVSKAGDGHFKVEYMGKSVNIASTPSNRRTVLNDRARVRRNLGLKLAG